MKTTRVQITVLFTIVFGLTGLMPLFASDSSDAESLRQKCEKEIKGLEICVSNFGDSNDKGKFDEGTKTIKLAKIQITQSRFKEAIDSYNVYLKLQSETYKSLAEKYLERTKKINDEIAVELSDSIDQPKVSDYFKLAYRNLEDAKTAMTRTYSVQAIDACRRSKKYSIGTYGLVKKPVPDQYKIDTLDNDLKTAAK